MTATQSDLPTASDLARTLVRCVLLVLILGVLITLAFTRSYFAPPDTPLTTARASNRLGFPPDPKSETGAVTKLDDTDSSETATTPDHTDPENTTTRDPIDTTGAREATTDMRESDPVRVAQPDPVDWKNKKITKPVPGVRVAVFLGRRTMGLLKNRQYIRAYYYLAYAPDPSAPKMLKDDKRVPQGTYRILEHALVGNVMTLVLDYPNKADAARALAAGAIDQATHDRIVAAAAAGKAPPWDTPMGGPIRITGDRETRNVTTGDISIRQKNMEELWLAVKKGTTVQIVK